MERSISRARNAAASRSIDSPKGLCYKRRIMGKETSPPVAPGVPRVQVIGVTGMPEIGEGDKLGPIIVASAEAQGTPIAPGDIVVVTQKIVSKAEGRIVDLRDVEPSVLARNLAEETGRDSRLLELVLRESRSIVRMDITRGIIITETKHGFVCANAGVDTSNVPGDTLASLLPRDPDASAASIRGQIRRALKGSRLAVIISDTFGRAWREGHANFAIGVAGINSIRDYRGTPDAWGRELKVTRMAVADELASSAELVTGKADGVPVAIVRGYGYSDGPDGVQILLRHPSTDLFR